MDNWRLYLILVGCLVLGCVSASSIGKLQMIQELAFIKQDILTEHVSLFSFSFFLRTKKKKEKECDGIEEPNKLILCYANGSISLPTHVDVCRCSHLVVPFAVNTLINASITLDEGN